MRFTERRNGKKMTTVRYDLHIPEELVDSVAKHLGLSKSAAFEKLLEHFTYTISERLGTHGLTIWKDPKGDEAPVLLDSYMDEWHDLTPDDIVLTPSKEHPDEPGPMSDHLLFRRHASSNRPRKKR